MNTLDKLQKSFPKSYRNGNVLLINADCMDVMKLLDDKEFCLACVDPPYGIKASSGASTNGTMRKKIASGEIKGGSWDDSIPTDDYFNELFRISKEQIIWGGNYFGLPANKCFLIWDKGESIYNRDFAECEMAWSSFDKCARIFKKFPNQNDRIHPTQKPVDLYDWVIQRFAKQGDKIIDTHLGSGSSAIAAHYFGVDFVGCELDKSYFDAAKARFDMATKQLAMSI